MRLTNVIYLFVYKSIIFHSIREARIILFQRAINLVQPNKSNVVETK